MNTNLNTKIIKKYKSTPQKIRVMTEDWVNNEIFCPNCGSNIESYENSKPVADFYCLNCNEDYELKSKKDRMGNKIVDGAYKTMIERLKSDNNPNFFLLNYDFKNFEILNFFVIPKHFFVLEIIEKRNPLSENSRRRGWVGCNISIEHIPQSGKIFYIKNREKESKNNVLKNWEKTKFLREEKEILKRGWILDVMRCIESLNKKQFNIDEIYSFERYLSKKYTDNKHIKDKIRQQLQFLRDKGYIDFISRGEYRLL
jgi:type II restriction enzyme